MNFIVFYILNWSSEDQREQDYLFSLSQCEPILVTWLPFSLNGIIHMHFRGWSVAKLLSLNWLEHVKWYLSVYYFLITFIKVKILLTQLSLSSSFRICIPFTFPKCFIHVNWLVLLAFVQIMSVLSLETLTFLVYSYYFYFR